MTEYHRRFFSDLTWNRLRRGVFQSLDGLTDALDLYVHQHNANPKPFIWTAKATDILGRYCAHRQHSREVILLEALH